MRYARILLLALLLVITHGAVAHADSGLAGTWHSDSLRDNSVGYWFEVTPVKGSEAAFVGTMRFTHRDGRRVSTTPIAITMDGTRMEVRARQGSFDRSAGPLRGVMNAERNELRLINCQARLRLVMAHDLASDCTFRPAAAG